MFVSVSPRTSWMHADFRVKDPTGWQMTTAQAKTLLMMRHNVSANGCDGVLEQLDGIGARWVSG